MKTIILTAALILAFGTAAAQLSIERQLIGNAGQKLQSSNLQADFSLGETFIMVADNGSQSASQGFHQAISGPAASLENGLGDQSILLYPQPAGASLYLRLSEAPSERLQLRIYNLMGQQIAPGSMEISPQQTEYQLSLPDWGPGAYMLQLLNEEGQVVFQQKWWKL